MPRLIDRFGRKRCQKKRKDASYQFLYEFVQKYVVLNELWAGKNSFSTYICYTVDVLFCGHFSYFGPILIFSSGMDFFVQFSCNLNMMYRQIYKKKNGKKIFKKGVKYFFCHQGLETL